ncbi:unnamed protein product [Microthlaspi erraticum]|uniref:DUF4283 domain-containing protein n=1 Tax=Microthlaspi erraticum TaxID=1685480 RepID=A0A6D2HBS9_9BRAS|nr:unnamed protein product [Microthlaspi erraticum]
MEPHARSREFPPPPSFFIMVAGASSPPSSLPPDLLFLSSSPPLGSDLVSSVTPAPHVAAVSSIPSSGAVASPAVLSGALTHSGKPASWVSNFKPQFKNLSKIGSPTISSDGIPQIQAPNSIVLSSSRMWKNHIVAYFHGNPPSPAKIFSDLNPIWGLKGRISIKHHSSGVFLILLPDVETRNWVLDVGFWHSGNCSIIVTSWEVSTDIRKMKLVHAPVWILFRRVPPELWSEVGFSTIASAVGIPVHTEFPNIKPYTNGVVKLRVVIELAKKRANSIRIKDKFGNSALVLMEVLKMPPKCGNCKEFGHLNLRCPASILKPGLQLPKPQEPAPSVCLEEAHSDSNSIPPQQESGIDPPIEKAQEAVTIDSTGSLVSDSPLPVVPHEIGIRESSSSSEPNDGFTMVSRRSSPPPVSQTASESKRLASPVTSAQFGEEEEIIENAQLRRAQRQQASHRTPPLLIEFSSSLNPEKVAVSDLATCFVGSSEHLPIAGVPVSDS